MHLQGFEAERRAQAVVRAKRRALGWLPERARHGLLARCFRAPGLHALGEITADVVAAVDSGQAGLVRPDQISGRLLDLDAAGAGVTLTSGNVSSWADELGGGHTFDDGSSSSKRPAPEADSWNPGTGIKSILFDGSSDILTCSSGLASSLGGGTDNKYTLAIVGQYVTQPTGHNVFFSLTNSSTITQFIDWGKDTDTGPVEKWRVARVDDSGANGDVLWGTPDTSRHVWVYVFHGTTIHVYLDGVVVIGTDGGAGHVHDVGAITLDRATIGGRWRGASTFSGYGNVRIPRVLAYDDEVSNATAKGLSRWLMSHYRV